MATEKVKVKLFKEWLLSFFSAQLILQVAKDTKAWIRVREITPFHFVLALTFFFSAGVVRSLKSFLESFSLASGKTISYGSFHPRFKPELVNFLKKLIELSCYKLIEAEHELTHKLEGFLDLVIADSTPVIRNVQSP